MMRYRFCKDYDGHNYLIPAELYALFTELQENGDWDEFSDTFDERRIDGLNEWTFKDPKRG